MQVSETKVSINFQSPEEVIKQTRLGQFHYFNTVPLEFPQRVTPRLPRHMKLTARLYHEVLWQTLIKQVTLFTSLQCIMSPSCSTLAMLVPYEASQVLKRCSTLLFLILPAKLRRKWDETVPKTRRHWLSWEQTAEFPLPASCLTTGVCCLLLFKETTSSWGFVSTERGYNFCVVALTNLGLYFDRAQKCNGNCHRHYWTSATKETFLNCSVNAESNYEGY